MSKLVTLIDGVQDIDDVGGSDEDLHPASSESPSASEKHARPRVRPESDWTELTPAAARKSGLHELDTQARRRIWQMLAQKIPQRGSTYTFVSKGEVAQDELDSNDARAGTAKDASKNGDGTATTTTQHFASTFRNLVRPVDRRASTLAMLRYPQLPGVVTLSGSQDPIGLGLVTLSDARVLYDYFLCHINPWAMIFDPHLVSHDSLRQSSAHLYTTVLFLASRYIEPAQAGRLNSGDHAITINTSRALGSHARSLTMIAFATGDRRLETGVAVYLSSVWKEADDNFTILYCSYAAKIMSDISTELLSLHANDSTNGDQHQIRVRRHQQRQFLFHFIQEHTHLLHFAPRPNFDRGPSLLRNLLAWSDDALATQDDVLLCADIDSVLLQTKYKSIMETAQAQETRREAGYQGGSECFLLLQSFMDELEGWSSRWEYQATKIDRRFAEVRGRQGLQTFPSTLSLEARMNLLHIMRSSLVMQISSIAFRASLRDINKAKAATATGPADTASISYLSTLDDRAEQVYYTCLNSALTLLNHTVQMPSSVLRHAQDMIMVLAPHAALLATYLISLPLPQLREAPRQNLEHDKVKTRIRRRKEYERKSLCLMRDTLECFRRAVMRSDDHVELCAQYFDSLLNVIEGEAQRRPGHTVSGVKRSRDSLDIGDNTQLDEQKANTSSTAGQRNGSSVDSLAAETLLNLHSESTPLNTVSDTLSMSNAAPGSRFDLHPLHMLSSDIFTSTMAGTGMFGDSAASPGAFSLGAPDTLDFVSTSVPPSATGASTPVDWTWLQSFLDVPEFTWM